MVPLDVCCGIPLVVIVVVIVVVVIVVVVVLVGVGVTSGVIAIIMTSTLNDKLASY